MSRHTHFKRGHARARRSVGPAAAAFKIERQVVVGQRMMKGRRFGRWRNRQG